MVKPSALLYIAGPYVHDYYNPCRRTCNTTGVYGVWRKENIMKKITVYQTNNNRDFINNMLASIEGDKPFTPIQRMEEVVMLRQDGEDSDILEELFGKLNDEEYRYSINYSMSVGDIVRIDNTYYRCLGSGWKDISTEC